VNDIIDITNQNPTTQSNQLIRPDMTLEEADQCIRDIKGDLSNILEKILDLYERKGWKVKGYENWEKCVTAEFEQHRSYMYRQLKAAKIQKLLSPQGDLNIPEKHLRHLARLKTPELQRAAWQKAVETAPNGKVTEKHMRTIVNETTGQCRTSSPPSQLLSFLTLVPYSIRARNRLSYYGFWF
jgi:hypothetical protein